MIHAQVTPAEKAALQAVFNALDGPNWKSQNNADTSDDWDFTQPITNAWYGVTIVGNNITELKLSYFNDQNNLSGSIPPEIGNFPFIKKMQIEYADLTGTTIPVEIGNLTTLERLEIGSNKLGGNIPNSIGNLVNLTYLNVSHNKNLTGSIPTSIGNLGLLESLFVSDNQLNGVIPNEITQLTSLKWLGLDRNLFLGPIPATIGNLTSLEYLYLWNNPNLTGSLPNSIGNLSNLIHLWISDTAINGFIPTSISGLTSLIKFDMQNNQLSGVIPDEFGGLPVLQWLRLYGNQLTGNIPINLGVSTSLTRLELNTNQLTGIIPDQLGNINTLEVLNLGFNNLSGTIPNTLVGLSNLIGLILNTNQLTGNIPNQIGDIITLKFLNLSDNNLSGTIPNNFRNLNDLRSLDLSFNKLSGDITDLTNINLLNVFRFYNNNFQFGGFETEFVNYDTNINTFQYNPQAKVDVIETLNLTQGDNRTMVTNCSGSQNNYQWFKDNVALTNGGTFSGTQTATLSLTNIQVADAGVYHCKVTSNIVTGLTIERNDITLNVTAPTCTISTAEKNALLALYNSTGGPNWTSENDGDTTNDWNIANPIEKWFGLTVDCVNNTVTGINLTQSTTNGNNLIGVIPSEIQDLVNLNVLILRDNTLSGTIIPEIYSLTNLKTLNLNDNPLTGTVLPQIANLTNLTRLELEKNNLTGTIIPEIYTLTNLTFLNLRYNQLTGIISTQFGNLTNLTSLSIGGNKLSGTIPIELGNLISLVSLDVGGNQLTGTIPKELGNLINLKYLWLFSNQLTGSVPNSFQNLTSLGSFYIFNNQLSGVIPDLTGLPLFWVVIDHNAFQFGDFENEFVVYDGISLGFYDDPQAKVDVIETLNLTQGDNRTMVTNCSGSQNNYQWFKDNVALTDGGVFSGTQTATLNLTNIQVADAGVYHCKVTSNIVTGLTIERNDIILNVNNTTTYACNYAAEVLGFSSQWSSGGWNAQQALGEFDTYPNYGDISTAWASQTTNQREYLELRFDNPSPINAIHIYETYNAGAVDIVSVKNPNTNNWEVVYTATPVHITNSRILQITFPLTSFNVSEVRIDIDGASVPSWNEIDAVAINSVFSDAGDDQILTCNTTSLNLGGACTTDNATYLWSTTDGNIVSGINSLNAIIDLPGTYTLTVTKYGVSMSDDVIVTTNYTSPNIDNINTISGCLNITLPTITGTNLSGNQQFYTQTNGAGTSYAEGTVLNYSDFSLYPVTLYAYDVNGTSFPSNCSDETSFTININPQPTEPIIECWETNTWDATSCSWITTGTQPIKPTLECYETATFNNTSCAWEVTGTQPIKPTLECYETATFNNISCTWDITGTQPPKPTLKCWETATFNNTSCTWEVTGTQPLKPTIECYETATFNNTSCTWDVTGTQPTQPTLECWETATFNNTTCVWDVTGTQPLKPTLECWETATFNNTTCVWDVTGTEPAPVDVLPDITECNNYTLPILIIGNYFTAPNGGGTMLTAGAVITASQTIYIYKVNGTCTDESSFEINIEKTSSVINATINTVDFSATNNSISINVINPIHNYEYSINNGISFQLSNNFENLEPGIYNVIIRSDSPCEPDFIKTVSVLNYPRFFTPNGDGNNDTWQIKGITPQNFKEIRIFNRFGKVVSILKSSNQTWNGLYKNTKLFSSSYWFVATLIQNGKEIQIKGYFALKR